MNLSVNNYILFVSEHVVAVIKAGLGFGQSLVMINVCLQPLQNCFFTSLSYRNLKLSKTKYNFVTIVSGADRGKRRDLENGFSKT